MKSKQTMIQEIREKCIENDPSIKELVLGCKVKLLDNPSYPNYTGWFIGREYVGDGKWRECVLHPNNQVYPIDDKFEIIGREIRLADVLLVVKERYLNGTLQRDGEFRNATEWFGEISWDWDIKNDSLDSQSEETISFIHSLLFDNKESN